MALTTKYIYSCDRCLTEEDFTVSGTEPTGWIKLTIREQSDGGGALLSERMLCDTCGSVDQLARWLAGWPLASPALLDVDGIQDTELEEAVPVEDTGSGVVGALASLIGEPVPVVNLIVQPRTLLGGLGL